MWLPVTFLVVVGYWGFTLEYWMLKKYLLNLNAVIHRIESNRNRFLNSIP